MNFSPQIFFPFLHHQYFLNVFFSSIIQSSVHSVKINIERQVVFFEEKKNEGNFLKRMMIFFRKQNIPDFLLHMIKLPGFL